MPSWTKPTQEVRRKGRSYSSIAVFLTAVPAFVVGLLLGVLTSSSSTSSSFCSPTAAATTPFSGSNDADATLLLMPMRMRELEQQRLRERGNSKNINNNNDVNMETLCLDHVARALEKQRHHPTTTTSSSLFPPPTVGSFATVMARVSKRDFTEMIDTGVPLDLPSVGTKEVLLLYSHRAAVPKAFGADYNQIPTLNMPEAIEKCDLLNILLTQHGDRRQCVAIVPQYESYHVQKWMRVHNETGALDRSADLRMVSRGHQVNGLQNFEPPDLNRDTRSHWSLLQKYFETVDDVLAELQPILSKIAIQNAVIVMVCNFGQSELLVNFVCAARQRNLDLSNVIVFTTDPETTDLVVAMGLTAYYDHRNFRDISREAAERYGDPQFVAMMMAKVICVQLVSMLGLDFLFQDVDIVWNKNPLDYFQDKSLPAYNFDILFQDDGGHTLRYAPYSANSGFYFVRYNKRTRHFLTSLLMTADLVLSTWSHQQALVATLNEHVSLFGLKVKVLSRDMEEFPGGYHYHQSADKKYMKDLFEGKLKPYIFHMSWTLNKDDKIYFFQQMGEWFVESQCIQKQVSEIGANSVPGCCSAKPLFSCHYRDKPSVKPCKDSPPMDAGQPSWW